MNFVENPKTWSERARIQRMLPRHFKIMELALAGHTGKDIAEMVGLTSNAVSMIMRSPIFQAELAYRRKETNEGEVLKMDAESIKGKARSILEQASIKAANKVKELIDHDDAAIALRASENLLDRVFGKGEKNSHSTIINISADNVNLLNQALAESRVLKEPQDVQSFISSAHSPSADSSQDGQSNVYQTSQGGCETGNGHRIIQEQSFRQVEKVA